MLHYEQWSKDCHTWIFAAKHGFDELRTEAWTACKIQVYEILGKQDGVKELFDQGLSLEALSNVVSELAKYYCAKERTARVKDLSLGLRERFGVSAMGGPEAGS
jgi:hypothetical protein